ncbi:class I SAM-dependent methyltransferase [Sporosarcina sp. Te-1]|uniref:class I SAM-dependent methyltransferase n=1 Tax=Sporosarcina sp. Te-1 TaxID=2818390 RepID=UPI001A9F02F0|nr:class I SAM-dependent methyltransferase [Sporosarcina sp. Te-1]QTD41422.1 class I SAM-dependent methyltransferase [Sporosarcina sp. Te-1]
MTNTENIFTFIDEKAGQEQGYYLDGVISACESWLSGKETPRVTGNVTKEEIRKGLQLAILKGMKQSAQPHHQMTPDAIGILVGYIASSLVRNQNDVTLLDPAAGTGNLLYTVMNSMDGTASASAVEIDDLLVRLAAVSADLLEQPIRFYVQDGLRPLLVDPVDLVISDLPVGYYPDDDNALNFEMMPTEGHAYSHHLFFEQSLNHLKPGGFGLFITTVNLFESDQSELLQKYLKRHAIIRAIIQLPDSLFRNVSHAKFILILQKPTEDMAAKSAPDVMLAKVPDMMDKNLMTQFFRKIDNWIEEM